LPKTTNKDPEGVMPPLFAANKNIKVAFNGLLRCMKIKPMASTATGGVFRATITDRELAKAMVFHCKRIFLDTSSVFY